MRGAHTSNARNICAEWQSTSISKRSAGSGIWPVFASSLLFRVCRSIRSSRRLHMALALPLPQHPQQRRLLPLALPQHPQQCLVLDLALPRHPLRGLRLHPRATARLARGPHRHQGRRFALPEHPQRCRLLDPALPQHPLRGLRLRPRATARLARRPHRHQGRRSRFQPHPFRRQGWSSGSHKLKIASTTVWCHYMPTSKRVIVCLRMCRRHWSRGGGTRRPLRAGRSERPSSSVTGRPHGTCGELPFFAHCCARESVGSTGE